METLQLQLDMSRSLLTALNDTLASQQRLMYRTSDQSSAAQEAVANFQQASERMQNATQNAESFATSVHSTINSNSFSNRIESNANQLAQSLQEGLLQANNRVSQSNRSIENTNQNIVRSTNNVLGTNEVLENLSDVPDQLNDINTSVETLESDVESTTGTTNTLSNIIAMLGEVKDAFLTGGLSLVGTILKGLLNFVKFAISAFTTLAGSLVKMYKFALTLPFTIANSAVELGNKIRTDLVEVIQSAGEEAKESFDLTSDIGKGADKLTQTAKGLLKTFQSPRTRLARLFGMGASGAAAFLNATVKAVADMGQYAEIFGPSILGNTKNAQYLVEMQKAMGIGAQEMAYYALESYNAGISPIDTLHKTSQIIKGIADRYDFDFKALTKEFHTLRTNIVEFGHLSSNEIGNLVGKLRAMKVKTEDAVNVFKKFTSFEEAAKASAMLFQSFEMNIDAFDLLTARDPGEMLQQFRDAMFQTGKNFKDLNRHEKALMSSITGISEQSLSTLMNYMDLGLTQDEARKRMKEEDPTKEQTKMIKGLTSAIKQFQKTITFSSPFDAFFQGLLENQMNQDELKGSLISLSEIYSDIRNIGFSLDLSQVTAILQPITEILRRIDILVNGNKFKEVLNLTATTAAGFLDEVSYDLQSSKTGKEFTKLRYKIESIIQISEKNKSVKADDINEAIVSALKNSINLESLDKNILDSLSKSGIIKKLKGGAYEFVEEIHASKFFSVFASLAENNQNDPKITAAIKALFEKSEKAYNSALTGTLDLTVQEINSEAEKRTSIKGRISNLYDNLLEIVSEGGSSYKGFHDMGGNIMGSILRGIIKGLTAGFYLLSGSSSKAVKALGLEVSDQIKKDAKEKDMNPNDFTLLNHLGITEIDAMQIKDGLGNEISRVIERLPKMANIASSIISDLLEVMSGVAYTILGVVGDILESTYEEQNFFVRMALREKGFNPTEMQIAKKRAKANPLKIKTQSLSTTISSAFEDLPENVSSEELYKVLGNNIAVFHQIRENSFDKNSSAYAFLNSPEILSYLDVLTLDKNFFMADSSAVDDPDYGSRIGALYEIIEKAVNLDQSSALPNYYFQIDKFKGNENFYKWMKSLKFSPEIEAKKMISEMDFLSSKSKMISHARSFPDIGVFGTSVDKMRSNIIKHVQEKSYRIGEGKDPIYSAIEKFIKDKSEKKEPASKAQDISYTGKNAILCTPNKNYILDDHDSVLAAKEGGFLNNLLIEVTNNFNENTENSISFMKEKSKAKIEATTLACKKLVKSVVDSSTIDKDASEEDFIKIFDVYDEIISIINNREVLVSQSKIQIES